jgi:zinc transporter ZupT
MNLAFLAGTLLALALGPVLYLGARARPRLVRGLDVFVMISVSALVAFEVVPGTYVDGGLWSIACLLVGALGPTLLERMGGALKREAHLAALWLALVGLVLHAFADGAGLAPSGTDAGTALGLAVVLHSVPVGLAVWWLVAPALGVGPAVGVIAAMCLATVAGYALATGLSNLLGPQVLACIQALVAGFILHVVFGRPHLDHGHDHPHGDRDAQRTPRPSHRGDAP